MNDMISIQRFNFGKTAIELFAPDNPQQVLHFHSPYWAKVWPAALALCNFLEQRASYLKDKNVLELAAGLGLPGLFAASVARHVCLSDIEPQAIALLEKSVCHNALTNVSCRVIDWNNIANVETPDLVLLSDVNYEPASFTALAAAVEHFLSGQCTIILSTPQRLMAKEFITSVLPYCIEQVEIVVDESTAISIFVLRKQY